MMISKIFSKPKNKSRDVIISLEIGSGFIKSVEASFFKGKHLLRLMSKKVSSREDSVISQELLEFFDANKIQSRRVLLNLPRHLVIARCLHLPSTNDEEIESMVKIESVKQIPHTDEEIITGYRIIEKLGDGYSDILLAVVQGSIINRLISIVKNANMEIEKITIGSESLLGWRSVVIKDYKKDLESNSALINVSSEYVDIDILEKGHIAFTRAFSHSEKDSVESIAEDVKRSIATYQKSKNLSVDSILMSGAGNKISELEPILKEKVNIPVTTISQVKDLDLDKSVEPDLAQASFVELIGLSLKSQDIKINLLPETVIKNNEARALKQRLFKTMILGGAILLILFGLAAKDIWSKSRYLMLLNSEVKKMEPKVVKAKRMKEDIRILKGEVEKKPFAIDILSEVYKVTPTGITFNLLDYESSKSIILKGTAPSLNDIIKFISLLENSAYFENVKVKYTAKRSIGSQEVTDFEVASHLSKVGQ